MTSELKSKYIREQKRYSYDELQSIFECPDNEMKSIIRMLKGYNVLKNVKVSVSQKDMSELMDIDIEIAEIGSSASYYYVFTFVGVIIVSGIILKCYPKYLLRSDEPKEELCQVLKVIDKCNSKKQSIYMFGDHSENKGFNLLSILLSLLQDYFENGIYSNAEETMEINGAGEIQWDRTINETFALIAERRPYYMQLYTRKRRSNDQDYYRRLHECVLTKVSNELKNADLLDIFSIPEVFLSGKELNDFGEKEYILYKLEQELSIQFNTRKQLVLKMIYTYISQGGMLTDRNSVLLIGTNSFNLVWEDVCADILDNHLYKQLNNLRLPTPLKPVYDGKKHLIDLIEKPCWTATGKEAEDTLKPDIITFSGNSVDMDFIICDAKYYNTMLEYNIPPRGQPGIESITKQYVYLLAYQNFIKEHNFSRVYNCFIMPVESDEVCIKGEVFMDMFKNLGMPDIKVRFLPATLAYKHYLEGTKLNIDSLKLEKNGNE